MSDTLYAERTVGQLVAEQPERALVFERLGLDYCCGGQRRLSDACESEGLDLNSVLHDLESCDSTAVAPNTDWTKTSLTQLADHIEQTHHAYLREALPRISSLIEKVVRAHGENDSRLQTLQTVFSKFREGIEAHLTKEEKMVFVLCRKLDTITERPHLHSRSGRGPFSDTISEHDDAGRELEQMRTLTDGFSPPTTACNTYRALLHALKELETDTHLHVHKENNILFLKAEKALNALK